MKLPELQKPEKYVGLYIFDFGDHVGVGFTAEEVAELLESEQYKDGKVYRIHRAYPDGRLELKGVPAQIFELEAGMFFYSIDLETARRDFKELVSLAVRTAPHTTALPPTMPATMTPVDSTPALWTTRPGVRVTA